MINKTTESAYILLSDQRKGKTETWFRSNVVLSTESKIARQIISVTENTLLFGSELATVAEENMEIILLPLVGGLQLRLDDLFKNVEVGEMISFTVKQGAGYHIANTYKEEIIAFLEIRLRLGDSDRVIGAAFDLTEKPNELIKLIDFPEMSIGQFDGRVDTSFELPEGKAVFAYAIEGAFEFQNRLLQPRDAIYLTEKTVTNIEFESLSPGAIILTLLVDA